MHLKLLFLCSLSPKFLVLLLAGCLSKHSLADSPHIPFSTWNSWALPFYSQTLSHSHSHQFVSLQTSTQVSLSHPQVKLTAPSL